MAYRPTLSATLSAITSATFLSGVQRFGRGGWGFTIEAHTPLHTCVRPFTLRRETGLILSVAQVPLQVLYSDSHHEHTQEGPRLIRIRVNPG